MNDSKICIVYNGLRTCADPNKQSNDRPTWDDETLLYSDAEWLSVASVLDDRNGLYYKNPLGYLFNKFGLSDDALRIAGAYCLKEGLKNVDRFIQAKQAYLQVCFEKAYDGKASIDSLIRLMNCEALDLYVGQQPKESPLLEMTGGAWDVPKIQELWIDERYISSLNNLKAYNAFEQPEPAPLDERFHFNYLGPHMTPVLSEMESAPPTRWQRIKKFFLKIIFRNDK